MAVTVLRRDLRVGPLLAEGGQGRVYALADRPGIVLKAYRSPLPKAELDALVEWPQVLPPGHERVLAAAAWPTQVVLDRSEDADQAVGLLMPRAPRRFTLRHRDGSAHLSTLSYLSADPAQRAAAYGLHLPPPLSPPRVGLVYALARVLDAFERAAPAVSHGDLSSKNVLWSLQRGPEVFLLDCDNSALVCPSGLAPGADLEPVAYPVVARRRAMTPNWDDPAVPSGTNPTLWSDRYSLALIFLRVVAAAHFPIQTLQKRGEHIALDVDVPSEVRRATSLAADSPLWAACQAGLSVGEPDVRPAPAVWVDALQRLLRETGGQAVLASLIASMGEWMPPPEGVPPVASAAHSNVEVRPVAAEARSTAWAVTRRPGPDTAAEPDESALAGAAGGYRMASQPARTGTFGPSGFGPGGVITAAPPARSASWRSYLRTFGRWWTATHRRALRLLRATDRRAEGVRVAAVCAAADLGIAVVLMFVAAMVVSPFLGI